MVHFSIPSLGSFVLNDQWRHQWNTHCSFLSTSYTVTATNAGGSGTATVTITVNDIAPSSVTYSPSTLTLTKDTAMTTVTPTASGRYRHLVVDQRNAPSRPFLLDLDRCHFRYTNDRYLGDHLHGHGEQHGRQCNDHGDHCCLRCSTFGHHLQPEFTHTYQGFNHDNRDTHIQWAERSLHGRFPHRFHRLSFSTSTGAISGTPTAVSSSANYTVTATNLGGSGTATVTIQVNDVSPYSLVYSGSPFTLTKGTAMTTATPTVSGGTVTSWSISPSLPTGLSFSTTNGAISGTPTSIMSSTTYTVTASNTGGSDTTTVTIVVNDAPRHPSLIAAVRSHSTKTQP